MAIQVLKPGLQTTVQELPGRVGLLSRGFFPAGPIDHLAFRIANALVGNDVNAAALELTLGNVTLQFEDAGLVAVTGASAEVKLGGSPVDLWRAIPVAAGDVLEIGAARNTGFRLYLAVAGSIDTPQVLGSRATYTMGSIGGVEGRALRKGDVLPVGSPARGNRLELDSRQRPAYTHEWELEVVPGPHASPEFLAEEDVKLLFGTMWTADRNSNRTGIRLDARRLTWARANGGIAGGHPSNILDTGYPVGGINLNGDTPVILGPDGPTSGGFVVVAVVAHASMWKLGQMRPGTDQVRLRPVSFEQARQAVFSQEEILGITRGSASHA
jgi:5-oxoprolinase (ATP-hydrolysing) subunit C